MFKVLRFALSSRLLQTHSPPRSAPRTFLSQAYYCNEIWEDRLNSPLLQKVNLDLLYHELDQRFQKTRRMSPVDVDIFANAVKNELFIDEMLDLVHKLRLTQDTGNTLDSTSHAVVRILMNHDRVNELLQTIDDRLNYGVFLDYYTGNILMDKFWKSGNFVGGALVASQFMLQEDLEHPLTVNLALLHCYNFLLNPGEWPQQPPPEEPEEEVKVRVKYLRNPFDDQHFDLRDPRKIVGKTLAEASKTRTDSIHKSLRILGLVLFGKEDSARKELENTGKLVKEIVDLVPEESQLKKELSPDLSSEDVQSFLQKQVSETVGVTSEKDIANQCGIFKQWETNRLQALEDQKKRLQTAERLAEVEKLQETLKQKEQKLWFFENEEKIELAIEEGVENTPLKPKHQEKLEEDYVPPEVKAKRNNLS